MRRLHRVHDATQPGRTPSPGPPRRCQRQAACTAGRPLGPQAALASRRPASRRSSGLAVPTGRALRKAASLSPACPLPSGREQGSRAGAPGPAWPEERERRPRLGGPRPGSHGAPHPRRAAGPAVAQQAPVCTAAGPPRRARLIPEARPRLQPASVHASSQQLTSLESGKLQAS